jgi:putative ATPase
VRSSFTDPVEITLEVAQDSIQRKMIGFDPTGDTHYDLASAFIKSMRGSDPDAAVYWMSRMLEAGEDPLFILRRMVIFAAEDVGLADPQALGVAVAALDAFRFVGMPEGFLPMTQATLYLATAPKSNTALSTYGAVKEDVDAHGALPVPAHIRNATTPLGKSLGWGAGYQYPHDHPGHHVAEQYLPPELAGRRYYAPSGEGYERTIAERLNRLREAVEPPGGVDVAPERRGK